MHVLFHWGPEITKKERRLAQKKKNHFHMRMFFLMQDRRQSDALAMSKNELRNPRKRADKKSDKEWINKVATVRNRLTGKKRDSKERWNRFAGTGGEGGRGL